MGNTDTGPEQVLVDAVKTYLGQLDSEEFDALIAAARPPEDTDSNDTDPRTLAARIPR